MTGRLAPTAAAALLRSAREEHHTLEPFTGIWPELDEAWGYAVQAADRAAREASGETVLGAKLGLTSAAKQRRMGVERPVVGFLTASMRLDADDLATAVAGWSQPRIEPEIAFVTAATITHALHHDEVAGAVASVGAAAEIIDSRWAGYRFLLPDVIADNTSAAGLVLGDEPRPLRDTGDLAAVRCTVTVDGAVVHEATGAAILGHPLRALQLLSEHLERHAQALPAGSLVLAGALTDAVPLRAARRYRLSLEGLGTIEADT